MSARSELLPRLKAAYEYLRNTGRIHTQKEFANAIGWRDTHLSSAMKGDTTRLTKGLMESIWENFPFFNVHWLLTGEGSMLNDEAESTNNNDEEEMDYKTEGEKSTFIPLVHIDSVGGVYSPNTIDASEQYLERMIPFPDARPGDVAIMQSGNSIATYIPGGAIM